MSGALNILSKSLLSFFFCAAWPPLGRRLVSEWDAFEGETPLLLFEILLFFADLPDSDGLDDLAPLLLIDAPLLTLLFLEILLLPLLLRSLRPILSGEADLYIVTTLGMSTERQHGRNDIMVRYLEDITWDSSKSLLSRTSSNRKCEKILTSFGANGAPKTSLASEILAHNMRASKHAGRAVVTRFLGLPAIVQSRLWAVAGFGSRRAQGILEQIRRIFCTLSSQAQTGCHSQRIHEHTQVQAKKDLLCQNFICFHLICDIVSA